MNLSDSLQQHLLLCEEIHFLLLEENRLLQTTRKPPGETFLVRKRELLPRLAASCLALRLGKATQGGAVSAHTGTLGRLQKKMLSLLLLDRENEKLLLKCALPGEALRVAAKPSSHLVTRAYSAAAVWP